VSGNGRRLKPMQPTAQTKLTRRPPRDDRERKIVGGSNRIVAALHQTAAAGFDIQIRKPEVISFEIKLREIVATDFDIKSEKTITIRFEVKPEKLFQWF
jgi:hypothetical protein